MKKGVLIFVVTVVVSAMANPVKNNEDFLGRKEHPRAIRATQPYHVQYQARYRPATPYEGYYGTLTFGAPSSTYSRPRAYYQDYQQPGISYRYVRRPSGTYNEHFGFNLYGSPIVYSSAYHV